MHGRKHTVVSLTIAKGCWSGRIRRWWRAASIAVACAAVLLPAAPAAASRPSVQCGTVLTADIKLRADLTCTGDGLIIGADGIAVDLGGHTLSGSGTGTGITITGRRNINVSNGTISEFAQSARIDGTQLATFTRVTMRAGISLFITFSEDIRFTGGTLRSVLGINGDRTTVTRSVVSGGGLSFVSSLDPVFTGNAITDAPVDLSEVSGAVIADNVIVRSPIVIGITNDSLVRRNRISGATNGVVVGDTAEGNRIIDNMFVDNRIGTLVQTSLLDQLTGTVISNNMYLRNGAAGVLFEVTGTGCSSCPQVTANRFVGNGFDSAGLTDHLGNPVADGLHFAVPESSPILVADNVTRHNARYGIFAPPGTVLDGGGNRSSGDPKGCLGVVCTP